MSWQSLVPRPSAFLPFGSSRLTRSELGSSPEPLGAHTNLGAAIIFPTESGPQHPVATKLKGPEKWKAVLSAVRNEYVLLKVPETEATPIASSK